MSRDDQGPCHFMSCKVIEALPDDLILEVVSRHRFYEHAVSDATKRQVAAKQQGFIAVPYKIELAFDVGERITWSRGVSPAIDKAWRDERRRKLGIGLASGSGPSIAEGGKKSTAPTDDSSPEQREITGCHVAQPEWWRREGRALRERREGHGTRPPKLTL
jgi:hypothetical protein